MDKSSHIKHSEELSTPKRPKPKNSSRVNAFTSYATGKSLLCQLSNRKRPVICQISKKKALRVYREIIIPMFASGLPLVPRKLNKSLSAAMTLKKGHKRVSSYQPSIQAPSNCSHSPQKLSQALTEAIELCRKKKNTMVKHLNESRSTHQEVKIDVQEMKHKVAHALWYLNLLKNTNKQRKTSIIHSMALAKTKTHYKTSADNNMTFRRELSLESKVNNSLNLKNTKIKHLLCIYHFANVVMGDQLQYMHLMHEADISLTTSISAQLEKLYSGAIELEFYESTIGKGLGTSCRKLDILISETVLGLRAFKHLSIELKKIKKGFFYNEEKFHTEIKKATVESKRTKDSIESLEKQNNYLDIEYEKIKTTYKTTRRHTKAKSLTNLPEWCQHCGNQYIEYENYDWSCKKHISAFFKGFYWCCGQTKRNAPGCAKTKHVSIKHASSSDEAEEINEVLCGSCKQRGHSAHHCTKDPNMQQDDNLEEELRRLNSVKCRIFKRKRVFTSVGTLALLQHSDEEDELIESTFSKYVKRFK